MVAAVANIPAHSAPVGYERVSCETGDPGEVAYGMACADGKQIKVWLDGVEQTHCITADASEGWVKRLIVSPSGNVAINMATGEILTEVVRGAVTIALV